MKNRPTLTRRQLAAILMVIGAFAAVFFWLFALANKSWVVIRIPSLPGSASPSYPLFEARIFATWLVSFGLGAIGWALLSRLMNNSKEHRTKLYKKRILELEQELVSVNRLLKATRKKTP